MICSSSEACLHFIDSKFEFYKQLLDREQQTSDQLIASIREQASNQQAFLQQLDYFEEESFKTYEENKTCNRMSRCSFENGRLRPFLFSSSL